MADPVKAVEELLRARKGLSTRQAKLELDGGDGDWTDYFRGKDLVRFIAANPGKVDAALKERGGRTDEETAAELVRTLLARGLIQRTERKYKRPKPGRTRLVKWPRTLLLVKDQQWDEASFFAWKHDRPTSVWYYISIVAIPVAVIAACLFPLAPFWARMALVYILSGLLVALLGLLAVRYVVFVCVWLVSGCSLWIFPNIMDEQGGLWDIILPVVEFKKCKSFAEAWKARLLSAVIAGGIVWLLASHSPDMAHLKEDVVKAHDSLFEYMEAMYNRNQTYLNGSTTQTAGMSSRPTGSSESSNSGKSRQAHASGTGKAEYTAKSGNSR